MEEWLMMVQNVGFPIVVTLYLLHRIERKLDEVTASIHMLPDKMLQTDRSSASQEGRPVHQIQQ